MAALPSRSVQAGAARRSATVRPVSTLPEHIISNILRTPAAVALTGRRTFDSGSFMVQQLSVSSIAASTQGADVFHGDRPVLPCAWRHAPRVAYCR